MTLKSKRSIRLRIAEIVALIVLSLLGALVHAQTAVDTVPEWQKAAGGKMSLFETTVHPKTGEDLAASGCHYTLTITAPEKEVHAIWVIFDRGGDVRDLDSDPAVLAFSRRESLALLLHGHCPGTRPDDHRDMNMDPAAGLGPALLRAIGQFAIQTGHAELSSAKLIFLGFSGAGVLCAKLANFMSGQTVAAILSAPGYYEGFGLETVKLNLPVDVPELIIAGGADSSSGSARPYEYFYKYRQQGAPWAFVLQNRSPHCCTANAKDLILHWLEAIIKDRRLSSAGPLHPIDQGRGWLASITRQNTDVRDTFGLATFNVSSPAIAPASMDRPLTQSDAGWLPDHSTARLWLAFERKAQHPILPLN